MSFKSLARWLLPNGPLERRRRAFRLSRLGLPDSAANAEAVEACHYELWPAFLRAGAPAWTLVDVGANEGDFITAAQCLAPVRRVYAFEPLPVCRGKLEAILSPNAASRLFPAAVGSSVGEITIHHTGNSKMSSALPPRPEVSADYEPGDFQVRAQLTVPLVTLDAALPGDEEFGLLKIDVQGLEMDVLAGAVAVLERTRAVLMEANYVRHYQGGASFNDVFAWMHAHGFGLAGVSPPYFGAEGPLWADALFVRRAGE